MQRRSFAAAIAACFLTLTACGGGGGAGGEGGGTESAEGETLTFGAALSLTGDLSREGTLTRDGYELCKKVVNERGGVQVGDTQQQLEIVYQDDTSTPDVAAQLVDRFNDEGVTLLLGPYGSASTEAAAAVVERNMQVMVEGAGADNKIFDKGYTRTFAVLTPASEYLGSIVQAVADLADPKPKTVAILSADDGFSKTAAEGGKAKAEEVGMEVVALEYFPNGATDVSGALTKIRGLKPDLILGSVHLAEGVAIIRQAKELGIKPSGGFGETVAPPTPDFVETLGPLAEGVLSGSQWTSATPGEDEFFGTAKDYAELYESEFGNEPEYHNAEASAACLALVMAIETAGSTEPDAVREALAALDEETFFGRITFDEKGMNSTKPMSVVQIQEGKVVTVWPEGPDAKKLRWPTTS